METKIQLQGFCKNMICAAFKNTGRALDFEIHFQGFENAGFAHFRLKIPPSSVNSELGS